MKTPFRKFRGLSLHRNDKRDLNLNQRSLAQLDELYQASQDMQDMRDCYDSLLSAAAATTNSAYEFSESLREMGDCLLEKTALNDDEDSGRVLLMLGKVQFEIQKQFDNYRAHVSRTITTPSESLLNELRTVEDMKKQCDDKRSIYEDLIAKFREKGKSKSSKGERFSFHQLQAAQEEFDEVATLFVFRMKSLKRGQSRSLLTQAARHHAAQLSFFRRALKSLEAVDPHVKLVTEQQHIDYQFSGLEDDDRDSMFLTDEDEDDEDSPDGSETHDDGELSFDYRRNDQGKDVSTTGNSMELDNTDLTFPHVAAESLGKENHTHVRKSTWESSAFVRDLNSGSKSAPLSGESNSDPSEKFRQMRQSSARRLHTYVLPTPVEAKSPDSQVRRTSTPNLWHSSPLEHKQYENILGEKEKFSGPIGTNTRSILKDSNNNSSKKTSPLPLPTSPPQFESSSASAAKKSKRQAFSGPLTSNIRSNKPLFSASGPISSTGPPQMFSGSLIGTPLPRPESAPKLSSMGSNFVSSPKISELHELPRPPAHLAFKKPSRLVGYSAPLVGSKGGPDLATAKKSGVPNLASTLPVPPLRNFSRSLSIPSSGQLEVPINFNTGETLPSIETVKDGASPPLTPLSLRIS